jgi:hypothetical protein
MKDPFRPQFTSREAAHTLGMSEPEFHELRAAKFPKYRISATVGDSTRDRRWSAADICRLAVLHGIHATGHHVPRKDRRDLVAAIDAATIEAAARELPRWLVVNAFQREIVENPLACWDPWKGWVAGAATVVDLTQVVRETLNALERLEAGGHGDRT